jgi:branched-chain amino acid aminotransferase
MNSICINGKILKENESGLLVSNRGYRYGDGLFETMKIINGGIILASLHFERLFNGLQLLKFKIPELFTVEKLQEEVLSLAKKNKCEQLARVRLSVFRGHGSLYDNDKDKEPQYTVECWPLNESVNKLNENGFVIDVYPIARKSCDIFSNLKTANFLPYTMAALYAKENKLNDSLVLNTIGNIADATIANIFLIENDIITTPALSEGCVSGVIRKLILNSGLQVKESVVTSEDVLKVDEVFLTNAINGVRWVKQFRDKTYTNLKTIEIYNRFIKPIFC